MKRGCWSYAPRRRFTPNCLIIPTWSASWVTHNQSILGSMQNDQLLLPGMCVKTPNLCLVTEFVKKGSLRTILLDRSIKLPCKLRLKLLYGAASGLAYLHSLVPEVIHRDLKSSNILVSLYISLNTNNI